MQLVDEIRRRIQSMPPGKSQAGLAERLGVDRTAVNKIGTGKRRIYAEELPALVDYLEIDGAFALDVEPTVNKSVHFVGVVEAGVWREAEAEMLDDRRLTLPAYPDPRYVGAKQYLLQVRGTSMDRHYPDGSYVFCVPVDQAVVRAGTHVHVARIDADGRVEETLKVYHQTKEGKIELRPDSSDERHKKPIPYSDRNRSTVQIRGVVIGSYRPAP